MDERLKMIPPVDAVLKSGAAVNAGNEFGRDAVLSIVRRVTEGLRAEITAGASSIGSRDEALAEIERRIGSETAVRSRGTLQKVINATGVVINTNLGRAPLSEAARKALVDIAAGYCTLEYDLSTGERGSRGNGAEMLAAELTGAEDAVIVNNCAAAAFLVLTVFAQGGEAIVSRGELVEIGGDFRIPDVLEQSGATLREVGTTNRTKLRDYERAIGETTKIILRVHTSNFRVRGFTESPFLADLAQLAHDNNILLVKDAGSGALIDLSRFGIDDEPVIRESVTAGADLVMFSGDKLLGGPQAGIIVGRRELISRVKRHPLYRALRPDKLTYAALEATFRAYALGNAVAEVPVLKMLSAPVGQMRARVSRFVERIKDISDVAIEIRDAESVVGGGAAPDSGIKSPVVLLSSRKMSAESIARKLRENDPPVITRIHNGRVLVDLRTVAEEDETALADAISSLTVTGSARQTHA